MNALRLQRILTPPSAICGAAVFFEMGATNASIWGPLLAVTIILLLYLVTEPAEAPSNLGHPILQVRAACFRCYGWSDSCIDVLGVQSQPLATLFVVVSRVSNSTQRDYSQPTRRGPILIVP